MVLFPRGGLGRLLVIILIITTISYLVLNIVSFAGNRWITYVDISVRFGLWRVCDTTAAGLCNAWADTFVSSITDNAFNSAKPGFIQSSQALEVISLIFYVIAAAFIVIGILNLRVFPFTQAFLVAIGLLFITIIFLSATLGVMSVQGRNNRPGAFLDWAWWNGLVGLIMTMICWLTLICLLIYMKYSSTSPVNQPKSSSNLPVNGLMTYPNNPPVISPLYTGNSFMNGPYNYNMYPENAMLSYGEQQYPSLTYDQSDPMMYPNIQYSDPYSYNQYYSEQNSSPVITELARQYVNDVYDRQYQSQFIDPYQQYYQDPYSINTYF